MREGGGEGWREVGENMYEKVCESLSVCDIGRVDWWTHTVIANVVGLVVLSHHI